MSHPKVDPRWILPGIDMVDSPFWQAARPRIVSCLDALGPRPRTLAEEQEEEKAQRMQAEMARLRLGPEQWEKEYR